eukprot:g3258.t1
MKSSRFVLSFTFLLVLHHVESTRSLFNRSDKFPLNYYCYTFIGVRVLTELGRELLAEQCITLQNTCAKSLINVAIAFRTNTHSWRVQGWINVKEKSTKQICWDGMDRRKVWLLTNNPVDDVKCEFEFRTATRFAKSNSDSVKFRDFCVNAISVFDIQQDTRLKNEFKFRMNSMDYSNSFISRCPDLGNCYKLSSFERFDFGSTVDSRVKRLSQCT